MVKVTVHDNQNETPEQTPDLSKLEFFQSQSQKWAERAQETMDNGHISNPESLRTLMYQVSTQALWDHEIEKESVRLGYHNSVGVLEENVKYYL